MRVVRGRTSRCAWGVAVVAALAVTSTQAIAQDGQDGGRRKGAAAITVEEIVVTATKKANTEVAQDVPLAITAFGADQLDAFQVRDIESLTFSVPNVSLDTVGTAKGVANFTIRGLGINSSIPSIDPTVGVFVDGMYLGVNFGVVFDTFDLESVEVLRGPQGLLFGRNVTGGAVLLRTKRPGNEFKISGKAGIESGIETRVSTAIEGPIIEDLISARVSASFRDDQGYFHNDFLSKKQGEEDSWSIRPIITFTPTEDISVDFIYEHGDTNGDGPPAQNRAIDSGFNFRNDEIGFIDGQRDHVVIEGNWDVDLGDAGSGRFTNIFAWRQVKQETLSDIDGQPTHLFHAGALVDQDQISNEFRFSGTFFERLDLTAGVYYFEQDILYRERRLILAALDTTLGGNQQQKTYGVFGNVDFRLLDNLTLTAGLRYTYEEKDVQIATFSISSDPCGPLGRDCDFDFNDGDSWKNLTPKIGLQWWATDEMQVYGHWTKGFRSGGYNFRNTSPDFDPGPFDEEEQNSFEVGFKSQLLDGQLRLNFAAFYNIIDDMQREINEPDPLAGVIQIIRNTADATVVGAELDVTYLVQDNFVLNGAIGWTDGEYDKVVFDLNSDGVVNGDDKNLELPRLTKWSFNFGATYDQEIGDFGLMTFRTNYAYRDRSFFTDNNQGTLPDGHVIDASLAFSPWGIEAGDREILATLSLYGKNLLDEGFRGGDTVLPATIAGVPAGGTFSPLKEGRVIGAEIRFDF